MRPPTKPLSPSSKETPATCHGQTIGLARNSTHRGARKAFRSRSHLGSGPTHVIPSSMPRRAKTRATTCLARASNSRARTLRQTRSRPGRRQGTRRAESGTQSVTSSLRLFAEASVAFSSAAAVRTSCFSARRGPIPEPRCKGEMASSRVPTKRQHCPRRRRRRVRTRATTFPRRPRRPTGRTSSALSAGRLLGKTSASAGAVGRPSPTSLSTEKADQP
mmetsp:Transcript_15173/g.36697  ORF Transcript_15173/g.36697 Transcript_15173/m.36697 type:complete len:219 (+) Transcript_15173:975-1631(+)